MVGPGNDPQDPPMPIFTLLQDLPESAMMIRPHYYRRCESWMSFMCLEVSNHTPQVRTLHRLLLHQHKYDFSLDSTQYLKCHQNLK
jgi:hypothetical protein